jgi:predicted AlkP superfamily phosphohydrolase/phosphomutase
MTPHNPKVLLVGWDAADWKVIRPLLEQGEMPNLARLIQSGVSGNLATLYPTLSPMLWTSIATGKRPGKHGIHGFVEPLRDASGVRPISSLSRTAKALWNILNQNGKRSRVVGWWPSHPAEPINGVMVSDFFHKAGEGLKPTKMVPGAVHPPEWAQRLAELRVTPMELPGEVLRLFVPEYDQIDQAKDKRLHALAKIIAETLTTHAAATAVLEQDDWDFAAVYYDAIDHFCHAFMRYHPPRLDWVQEADFALYQPIVANAYRYHDAMLGRLVQLAGPETTVILLSDHGFHSDARRPAYIPAEMAGPAVEHRHFGIVCLNGPGIKQGEPLYGGVLLDIAPTVLHLFGLPVGQDMDGKVLLAALDAPASVQTIPSWEAVPGDTGQHSPDTRLNPVASAEAMKQLIALGYIAPPPEDVQTHIQECVTELKYNLARAYDDESRYDLSVPLYQEMLAADPDEHRAVEHLFHALLRTGRHTEARDLLQTFDARCATRAPEARAELERRHAEKPETDLDTPRKPEDKREVHLRAQLRETASGYVMQRALLHFLLDSQVGRPAEVRRSYAALEALCAQLGATLPAVLVAEQLARNRENAAALALVKRALEHDPDHWQAQTLGAQLHLAARRYRAALDMAARSLGLVYHQPLMHYVMGHALLGLRDYAGAEQPLRIAVSQSPGFARAHALLSRLYGDHLQRPQEAAYHFIQAERLKKRRRAEKETTEELVVTPEPVARPVFASRPGATSPDPEQDVVVVCGLPRSGTSMLMQLLAAGGVEPLTDGKRVADEDNPRGYYEYEPATRLPQDSTWVKEARGRAVKLVLPLVPFLPPGERYRLLLIQRDLTAVVASQEKMLVRLGREAEGAQMGQEALIHEYCGQEHRVQRWLEARPGIGIMALDYDAILGNPGGTAEAIGEFLGRTLDVEAAAQAVHPELKRQTGLGG